MEKDKDKDKYRPNRYIPYVSGGGQQVSGSGGGGSYTDEEAQDAVGQILVNTPTIALTYDDGVPSISADVIEIPQSDVTDLVVDLATKVPTSRTLTASSPITGGGDLSADRSFGFDQAVDLNNNARVNVRKNSGADVGERRRLNFIEGTNITLTVADDAGSEEVDITIASSGGGGGLPVSDSNAVVQGSVDNTKQLRFEVDGFTTGQTRVMTPPDADAVLVGESNTQTLSNKTLNAPVFGAGSASANSWPKMTPGTLLTTPEDGAIEMDNECLYATLDGGNRGYVPVRHFIRCNATRSLPNDTNENPIFNSPANGRLTLEAGTYLFEALIQITGMSATSGNAAIDILGAGTATINDWLWHAWGVDQGTLTTGANRTGSSHVTQQSAASVILAATGNSMVVQIYGTFTVTAGGTIIPSITLVNAAAAVVAIGSHMIFERIGDVNIVSVGQWD